MAVLPESFGIPEGDDPIKHIKRIEDYIRYMTERINAFESKYTKLEEKVKELEGENGSIQV